MAQIKNMFIKGKMNLDLDERLIPKGEYRKAQNVLITNSEDSDVGAIENVRGHEEIIAGTLNLGNNIADDGVCIGSYVDTAKQRIFWFITNFTTERPDSGINNVDRADGSANENCRIVMRENTGQEFYLATGVFLNFTTTHHITGVNVVGNYLYWTDNYNQPRYIDIELAKQDATYYNCEDKISVAKVAPFLPPFLHNSNEASSNANKGDTYTLVTTDPSNATQHTKSEYMQERFIRFAYRYKYQDNTYSIISPFTQNVFKPLNSGVIEYGSAGKSDAPEPVVSASSQYMYQHNEAPLMKNAYDKVVMRIPIPTCTDNGIISEHTTTPGQVSSTSYPNLLKIDSIEILLREAGTGSIQIVDTIDLVNTSGLNFGRYKQKIATTGGYYYRQTVEYTYLAKDPFRVLPEKQLIRVGDNAPVRAKAQELVGSRLVYGNITLGYDLPRDEDNKRGIKFFVTSGPKGQGERSYTADSIGHYFHNHEQYKYHNIKQRRTYQVGMVLVDRYGRTSPVIPSTYKVDNLSDTHTVDAVVADLSTKYNNAYSWSTSGVSYGQALSVEFSDSRIVETNRTYDRVTRPNGWYSWRLVVKQVEQDYYNIYTSHPMNNWTVLDGTATSHANGGYRDQFIKGKFSTNPDSRSWFTLSNDNINKVPRSIKDFNPQVFEQENFGGRIISKTKEGVSGSEVKLYPKVVQIDGSIGSSYESKINPSADQDYINVLSIGSATDQGLSSLSNAKRDDGNNTATSVQDSFFADRERPYSFLADNHKNPVVAEIPNLYNEPVNVRGEFAADGSDVMRVTNNSNADMPFGYPKSKNAGLTVFETKPFESNIDIYYETSSCGLVRDLNEHCEQASNGPTNIQITPTFQETSFTAGTSANLLEEAKYTASSPHAQIGSLSATPYNTGGSSHVITGFEILAAANDVSDGNDLAKFSIAYESDKSYIKVSSRQATQSAAEAFNLSTGGTEVRLDWKNIRNLTSSQTNFVDQAGNLPSAFDNDGWYRVVFFKNHHSTADNNELTRVCKVINVVNNQITNFVNDDLTDTPTNIKQSWMLKSSDLFAFYNNNSNDVYTLVLRATQTNNITGNGNITVNIINTRPTASTVTSIYLPSNTQPAPSGRNFATLVGLNGSADTSNNGFGMTAALSGSDASSFELDAMQTDGQWRLNPSTTFNFASLFGTPSNGVYPDTPALSWSVTDNGNLSPLVATNISFIGVQVVEVTGWYSSVSKGSACAEHLNGSSATYYVVKHTGITVPSTNALYEDNKIYTNSQITTTLGAGWLVVENSSGGGIPYVVNSSGIITSIESVCNI